MSDMGAAAGVDHCVGCLFCVLVGFLLNRKRKGRICPRIPVLKETTRLLVAGMGPSGQAPQVQCFTAFAGEHLFRLTKAISLNRSRVAAESVKPARKTKVALSLRYRTHHLQLMSVGAAHTACN